MNVSEFKHLGVLGGNIRLLLFILESRRVKLNIYSLLNALLPRRGLGAAANLLRSKWINLKSLYAYPRLEDL